MSDQSIQAYTIAQGIIQYLRRNNQLHLLPQLAQLLLQSSRTVFSPDTAIVETVVPLSADQKKEISHRLSFALNKPIKVKNVINKSLIGGLHIQIGDNIIDLSLLAKIQDLRTALENTRS